MNRKVLILLIALLPFPRAIAQTASEWAGDTALTIVPEDADSAGAVSAYASHRFMVSPDTVCFTGRSWKLLLPLADGSPSVCCASADSLFVVPPVPDPGLYALADGGGIRGAVTFEGIVRGRTVALSLPVTFDLKPRILSVSEISRKINGSNPDYFDAVVGVRYVGSSYVHACVEEEDNPFLVSYYSSTPDYARLYLSDIALRKKAWLNITVRNAYGSDDCVFDLSAGGGDGDLSGIGKIGSGETEQGASRVDVYDVRGKFVGRGNRVDSLPKGIYVLKFHDGSGVCRKVKKTVVD